jgi:B12 binding domain
VAVVKVSTGDVIRDFTGFDAVAFTIPSSATYGVIRDCRYQSRYAGDPLILVGGVHPNFYPEQTLIDIRPHAVGIGEGEQTLPAASVPYHAAALTHIASGQLRSTFGWEHATVH